MNPEHDSFNCWVCGFHGRNLLPLMVPGSPEAREYSEGLPSRGQRCVVARMDSPSCTSLPAEYSPFLLNGSPDEAPYLTYLHRRGLTDRTVGLYRAGYADRGGLSGRIIIPSFDAHGSVNFWSARSIWPDVRPPYILPNASKDVVSNEHMVDWGKPVYLVEGIFDEIAIGPQAISLYGKFLLPQLVLRLVKNMPPIVHVCLDSDARREAVAIVRQLVSYDIRCSLVDLPGKDPGELGGAAVGSSAERSRPVSGSGGIISLGVR